VRCDLCGDDDPDTGAPSWVVFSKEAEAYTSGASILLPPMHYSRMGCVVGVVEV
jgi:hypothetical protein